MSTMRLTDGDENEQSANHPITLRGNTRMPARYREDDTPESMPNMPSQSKSKGNRSRSPRDIPFSRLSIEAPSVTQRGRRGRPKERRDRREETSQASPTPQAALTTQTYPTQYPKAAFPTVEEAVVPDNEDAERIRRITEWVEEDAEQGRWGESWDEVGAATPQRHVEMALEGRAKRAFGRGQSRTASWYRQELSLSKSLAVDELTPPTWKILRVLRYHWPIIAEQVFGENADLLRSHIKQIDESFHRPP